MQIEIKQESWMGGRSTYPVDTHVSDYLYALDKEEQLKKVRTYVAKLTDVLVQKGIISEGDYKYLINDTDELMEFINENI